MLRQATGRDRKRVVIYGKEAKQIIVESSSRSSRPSNHLTTRVVEQGTATAGVNRFLHSRVLYMSMKDTSSIPVRYQFDTSPIPLRYQSDTSSIPLRYQFDTTSIPPDYRCSYALVSKLAGGSVYSHTMHCAHTRSGDKGIPCHASGALPTQRGRARAPAHGGSGLPCVPATPCAPWRHRSSPARSLRRHSVRGSTTPPLRNVP